MAPECVEVYSRWNLENYLENLNPLRTLQDLPKDPYLRNRRFLRPLPKPQQPPATNTRPPGDHHMRAWNQSPIRAQTQTPRLDMIPKRPRRNEQDTTPTRTYPLQIRRQKHTTRPQLHNPKEETGHQYIKSFWNTYFINYRISSYSFRPWIVSTLE